MDETGLYMDRVGTPLGDMIMTSHGEALLGLWFQGERYELGNRNWPEPGEIRTCPFSRRPAAGWNCISRGRIPASPLP